MARRGENIYKRKDGRYEGRFLKGYSSMKKPIGGYIYGKQYYDVRARLAQKRAEQQRRPWNMRIVGSGQFEDWFDYWLERHIKPNVKRSTYDCYFMMARRHLLPRYGKLMLTDMTVKLLESLPDELRATPLSGGSCKSIYRLLKASLEEAVRQHLIQENPCRQMVFHKTKAKKARVLSLREQDIITKTASDLADLPMLIALYGGLRLGEVCALRWEDIDWANGEVSICRTAQRVRTGLCAAGSKTELVTDVPKTEESHRTIPLPAFIMNRLKALRKERSQFEGYVFGRMDKLLEPRVMQKRCAKMMRRLGLKGVHFHTFRHSYATRLLEMGIDLKTVSVLLGHSCVQTTLQFYAHSTPEQQRHAAILLEGLAS